MFLRPRTQVSSLAQSCFGIGFTISFVENIGTIPSLWTAVRAFMQYTREAGKNYFTNLARDSLYRFVTDEDGKEYNQCHFWTNFEIARLDLWQTQAYRDFFDFLDSLGGFFYERWGDAPVHSIFAALYLRKDQVHYFHDIGYKHSIYQHCPESPELGPRCYCDPANTLGKLEVKVSDVCQWVSQCFDLDYTDQMSCLTTYMEALRDSSSTKQMTIGELFAS